MGEGNTPSAAVEDGRHINPNKALWEKGDSAFACHEGNSRMMEGLLLGARTLDRDRKP